MKRWTVFDGLTVFAVSFLYLHNLPDCFSLFDEGIFASIADRLARGDVLYRDVVTHYLPGSFWLLLFSFKLLGATVAALRWSLALLAALAAVGVWRLARQHSGRALALLAGFSAPCVCYPIWWMASPHWYSAFAAIVAALLACQSVSTTRPSPWLVAAGAAGGVTILMLQPVGVAVTLSLAIAVLFVAYWSESRSTTWRHGALLLSGASFPVGSVAAYFAAKGVLAAMLSQTILWNLQHYAVAFRIPYATVPFGITKDHVLSLTVVFVAVVAPATYVATLAVALPNLLRRKASQRDQGLLILVSVAIGLLVGNLYYPDLVHLAAAAPLAFALLAGLAERLMASRDTGRLAVAFAWSIGLVVVAFTSVQRAQSECPATVDTPRGQINAPVDVAYDLRQFFYFSTHELARDDRFFVYPYAPGYYFLADRSNPTRHEYLFPYLEGAHSDEELREVVSELDHAQPRFVVLSLLWGRMMLERYNSPVERYIREKYHVARELPRTVLLERDGPGRNGRKLQLQAQEINVAVALCGQETVARRNDSSTPISRSSSTRARLQ